MKNGKLITMGHPYFTPESNIATHRIDESSEEFGYTPVLANVGSPSWYSNPNTFNNLNKTFEKNRYNYYECNDYYVDNNGNIKSIYCDGSMELGGAILAMCLGVNDDRSIETTRQPITIMNTSNAGLRYARFNDDETISDQGPVTELCVVGNENRPEGIYVPICNLKAMADAGVIIGEMLNHAISDDLIPDEALGIKSKDF